MKTKIIIGIASVIVLGILLIPRTEHLKDGGTIKYNAILYDFYKVHSMADPEDINKGIEYYEGIKLDILGIEVYNNVNY